MNAVIEAAIATWSLPERVKRLSLPSYRYHGDDLDDLTVMVAQSGESLAGVGAWMRARLADLPDGRTGLLLHGLYVHPDSMGRGIGRALLAAAQRDARDQGLDGLLVKAQADARGFFERRGLLHLPVRDATRDYPHRYWLAADAAMD